MARQFNQNFDIRRQVPIDVRIVVNDRLASVDNYTAATNFVGGDRNGIALGIASNTAYNGMVVWDNGIVAGGTNRTAGLYVLIDSTDPTSASNWHHLNAEDEVGTNVLVYDGTEAVDVPAGDMVVRETHSENLLYINTGSTTLTLAATTPDFEQTGLIEVSQQASVANLADIGDVDTGTPGVGQDGLVVQWNNTRQRYVLANPPARALGSIASDVSSTAATVDGQALVWDADGGTGGTGEWVAGDPRARALGDIASNVSTTAASATGQALVWDGSEWEPGDPRARALHAIASDVEGYTAGFGTNAPSQGQALVWVDDATDPDGADGSWQPRTIRTGDLADDVLHIQSLRSGASNDVAQNQYILGTYMGGARKLYRKTTSGDTQVTDTTDLSADTTNFTMVLDLYPYEGIRPFEANTEYTEGAIIRGDGTNGDSGAIYVAATDFQSGANLSSELSTNWFRLDISNSDILPGVDEDSREIPTVGSVTRAIDGHAQELRAWKESNVNVATPLTLTGSSLQTNEQIVNNVYWTTETVTSPVVTNDLIQFTQDSSLANLTINTRLFNKIERGVSFLSATDQALSTLGCIVKLYEAGGTPTSNAVRDIIVLDRSDDENDWVFQNGQIPVEYNHHDDDSTHALLYSIEYVSDITNSAYDIRLGDTELTAYYQTEREADSIIAEADNTQRDILIETTLDGESTTTEVLVSTASKAETAAGTTWTQDVETYFGTKVVFTTVQENGIPGTADADGNTSNNNFTPEIATELVIESGFARGIDTFFDGTDEGRTRTLRIDNVTDGGLVNVTSNGIEKTVTIGGGVDDLNDTVITDPSSLQTIRYTQAHSGDVGHWVNQDTVTEIDATDAADDGLTTADAVRDFVNPKIQTVDNEVQALRNTVNRLYLDLEEDHIVPWSEFEIEPGFFNGLPTGIGAATNVRQNRYHRFDGNNNIFNGGFRRIGAPYTVESSTYDFDNANEMLIQTRIGGSVIGNNTTFNTITGTSHFANVQEISFNGYDVGSKIDDTDPSGTNSYISNRTTLEDDGLITVADIAPGNSLTRNQISGECMGMVLSDTLARLSYVWLSGDIPAENDGSSGTVDYRQAEGVGYHNFGRPSNWEDLHSVGGNEFWSQRSLLTSIGDDEVRGDYNGYVFASLRDDVYVGSFIPRNENSDLSGYGINNNLIYPLMGRVGTYKRTAQRGNPNAADSYRVGERFGFWVRLRRRIGSSTTDHDSWTFWTASADSPGQFGISASTGIERFILREPVGTTFRIGEVPEITWECVNGYFPNNVNLNFGYDAGSDEILIMPGIGPDRAAQGGHWANSAPTISGTRIVPRERQGSGDRETNNLTVYQAFNAGINLHEQIRQEIDPTNSDGTQNTNATAQDDIAVYVTRQIPRSNSARAEFNMINMSALQTEHFWAMDNIASGQSVNWSGRFNMALESSIPWFNDDTTQFINYQPGSDPFCRLPAYNNIIDEVIEHFEDPPTSIITDADGNEERSIDRNRIDKDWVNKPDIVWNGSGSSAANYQSTYNNLNGAGIPTGLLVAARDWDRYDTVECWDEYPQDFSGVSSLVSRHMGIFRYVAGDTEGVPNADATTGFRTQPGDWIRLDLVYPTGAEERDDSNNLISDGLVDVNNGAENEFMNRRGEWARASNHQEETFFNVGTYLQEDDDEANVSFTGTLSNAQLLGENELSFQGDLVLRFDQTQPDTYDTDDYFDLEITNNGTISGISAGRYTAQFREYGTWAPQPLDPTNTPARSTIIFQNLRTITNESIGTPTTTETSDSSFALTAKLLENKGQVEVGAVHIQNGSITGSEIAGDTITNDKLTNEVRAVYMNVDNLFQVGGDVDTLTYPTLTNGNADLTFRGSNESVVSRRNTMEIDNGERITAAPAAGSWFSFELENTSGSSIVSNGVYTGQFKELIVISAGIEEHWLIENIRDEENNPITIPAAGGSNNADVTFRNVRHLGDLEVADGSITTAKIADGAVTPEKFDADAIDESIYYYEGNLYQRGHRVEDISFPPTPGTTNEVYSLLWRSSGFTGAAADVSTMRFRSLIADGTDQSSNRNASPQITANTLFGFTVTNSSSATILPNGNYFGTYERAEGDDFAWVVGDIRNVSTGVVLDTNASTTTATALTANIEFFEIREVGNEPETTYGSGLTATAETGDDQGDTSVVMDAPVYRVDYRGESTITTRDDAIRGLYANTGINRDKVTGDRYQIIFNRGAVIDEVFATYVGTGADAADATTFHDWEGDEDLEGQIEDILDDITALTFQNKNADFRTYPFSEYNEESSFRGQTTTDAYYEEYGATTPGAVRYVIPSGPTTGSDHLVLRRIASPNSDRDNAINRVVDLLIQLAYYQGSGVAGIGVREYQSGNTYNQGDRVFRLADGQIYLSVTDGNTEALPTDDSDSSNWYRMYPALQAMAGGSFVDGGEAVFGFIFESTGDNWVGDDSTANDDFNQEYRFHPQYHAPYLDQEIDFTFDADDEWEWTFVAPTYDNEEHTIEANLDNQSSNDIRVWMSRDRADFLSAALDTRDIHLTYTQLTRNTAGAITGFTNEDCRVSAVSFQGELEATANSDTLSSGQTYADITITGRTSTGNVDPDYEEQIHVYLEGLRSQYGGVIPDTENIRTGNVAVFEGDLRTVRTIDPHDSPGQKQIRVTQTGTGSSATFTTELINEGEDVVTGGAGISIESEVASIDLSANSGLEFNEDPSTNSSTLQVDFPNANGGAMTDPDGNTSNVARSNHFHYREFDLSDADADNVTVRPGEFIRLTGNTHITSTTDPGPQAGLYLREQNTPWAIGSSTTAANVAAQLVEFPEHAGHIDGVVIVQPGPGTTIPVVAGEYVISTATATNHNLYERVGSGSIDLTNSTDFSITANWTLITTFGSAATSTVAGLVELGSDTVQTVAANAVSSTANRTYATQVNSDGQLVVNVPWEDTDTDTIGIEYTYAVDVSLLAATSPLEAFIQDWNDTTAGSSGTFTPAAAAGTALVDNSYIRIDDTSSSGSQDLLYLYRSNGVEHQRNADNIAGQDPVAASNFTRITNPIDTTRGLSYDNESREIGVNNGNGLSFNSGALQVNFAGRGSSSSAARSDHEHFAHELIDWPTREWTPTGNEVFPDATTAGDPTGFIYGGASEYTRSSGTLTIDIEGNFDGGLESGDYIAGYAAGVTPSTTTTPQWVGRVTSAPSYDPGEEITTITFNVQGDYRSFIQDRHNEADDTFDRDSIEEIFGNVREITEDPNHTVIAQNSDGEIEQRDITQTSSDAGANLNIPTVGWVSNEVSNHINDTEVAITLNASTNAVEINSDTTDVAIRTAIGAGTSNLVIGTTAGTALDGGTTIPTQVTFEDNDADPGTARNLTSITFNTAGDEMTLSDGTNSRTFSGGGGGTGDVTLAGANAFTGNNTFGGTSTFDNTVTLANSVVTRPTSGTTNIAIDSSGNIVAGTEGGDDDRIPNSVTDNNFPRFNGTDGTMEQRTPAQVRGDITAAGTGVANTFSQRQTFNSGVNFANGTINIGSSVIAPAAEDDGFVRGVGIDDDGNLMAADCPIVFTHATTSARSTLANFVTQWDGRNTDISPTGITMKSGDMVRWRSVAGTRFNDETYIYNGENTDWGGTLDADDFHLIGSGTVAFNTDTQGDNLYVRTTTTDDQLETRTVAQAQEDLGIIASFTVEDDDGTQFTVDRSNNSIELKQQDGITVEHASGNTINFGLEGNVSYASSQSTTATAGQSWAADGRGDWVLTSRVQNTITGSVTNNYEIGNSQRLITRAQTVGGTVYDYITRFDITAITDLATGQENQSNSLDVTVSQSRKNGTTVVSRSWDFEGLDYQDAVATIDYIHTLRATQPQVRIRQGIASGTDTYNTQEYNSLRGEIERTTITVTPSQTNGNVVFTRADGNTDNFIVQDGEIVRVELTNAGSSGLPTEFYGEATSAGSTGFTLRNLRDTSDSTLTITTNTAVTTTITYDRLVLTGYRGDLLTQAQETRSYATKTRT